MASCYHSSKPPSTHLEPHGRQRVMSHLCCAECPSLDGATHRLLHHTGQCTHQLLHTHNPAVVVLAQYEGHIDRTEYTGGRGEWMMALSGPWLGEGLTCAAPENPWIRPVAMSGGPTTPQSTNLHRGDKHALSQLVCIDRALVGWVVNGRGKDSLQACQRYCERYGRLLIVWRVLTGSRGGGAWRACPGARHGPPRRSSSSHTGHTTSCNDRVGQGHRPRGEGQGRRVQVYRLALGKCTALTAKRSAVNAPCDHGLIEEERHVTHHVLPRHDTTTILSRRHHTNDQ